MRTFLLVIVFVAASISVSAQNESMSIKDVEPYSVKMILSEMKRCPDATWLDGRKGERKWNYTTGLELKAFMDAS